MTWIIHHQGLGVNTLQDMGCGDIGHVEGRILAHQDHIEFGQVNHLFGTQGRVIATLAPEFHRSGTCRYLAIAP